jgi:hypothetical protein
MATEQQHREQAEHNQRFLDAIDPARFPDWVATVAFYKSVHLVQMLFVRKAHDSGSHQKRNNILKRHYPEIWKEYRPLYAFSRLTRYRCYQATTADLTYLLRRLGRTEEAVRRAL